jgi:hypothetical protein
MLQAHLCIAITESLEKDEDMMCSSDLALFDLKEQVAHMFII